MLRGQDSFQELLYSLEMKPCRCCQASISEEAISCPHCGAPYPARQNYDGRGYEYKSKTTLFGWPLVHVSFKYRNRRPVVARGIIAIGQFACGFVTISQFGLGVFSLGQIVLSGLAIAQIGAAYSLIAMVGVYLHEGHGLVVRSLAKLLGGK
jgi:hypothetical protein